MVTVTRLEKINLPDYEACVFDFDGVIIDSEPLHAEAKRITLDHFRVPHSGQLFSDFKGRPDSAFFKHVAGELAQGRATALEMESHKRAAYTRLFGDISLVPGVLDFLALARAAFPKLGLATSATGYDFRLGANQFQLTKWFDAIVTGDDTARHKPDPEPYLKAIAALGVSSSTTLVVEDSPNGIRAAKAAHCKVVALTTTFTSGQLRDAGADWVVKSFAEFTQALGLQHSSSYADAS